MLVRLCVHVPANELETLATATKHEPVAMNACVGPDEAAAMFIVEYRNLEQIVQTLANTEGISAMFAHVLEMPKEQRRRRS